MQGCIHLLESVICAGGAPCAICADGWCRENEQGECEVTPGGCQTSEMCLQLGQCTPGANVQCRKSPTRGCHPIDLSQSNPNIPSTGQISEFTSCELSEDGCRSSSECAQSGRCGFSRTDGCIYTNEGCAASELCPGCTANEDGTRCIAPEPEDCGSTQECTDEGRCRWNNRGQFCEVTQDGCTASTACRDHLRCIADSELNCCRYANRDAPGGGCRNAD